MGWYHSHPFDVGPHSNCFLSATDVSTQLSWQLSEDRAGNPWVALVVSVGRRILLSNLNPLLFAVMCIQVDPLRGVAKGKPEIGAFRCYPPEHNTPQGLAPDGEFNKGFTRWRCKLNIFNGTGVVWADEHARNDRWGPSCVSYYQLEVFCCFSSGS